MQNPEVWSFHEPQTQFKIQQLDASSFSEKDTQHFFFNHLVCVVVPDCLRIPDQLAGQLSDDCEYYKVLDLNLSNLLKPAFISNFIQRGKLALLSIETRIDCDNCCAVTPAGNLILSLTKDTYQTLGLEGKPSHFTQRNKDRYIVQIDLKSTKLIPGKPNYERIKSALASLESFTVIVSWEPPEESTTICPSSVAKYFDEIECEVQQCEPSFKTHIVYSVKTPTLDETDIKQDNVVDFVEWLGMVAIDGDFSGDTDNYTNSYDVPEPNKELGPIRVLVWRGFYQPNQIGKLMNFLKQYNDAQDKIWTSMYVQGFSDAPVMESSLEQNYFTNGDNANIFIFKKPKGWCCKQRCSAKRYK